MSAEAITIKLLSTGYWHARGNGPCNWAQWPNGSEPSDDDFFPEASEEFRRALRRARNSTPGKPAKEDP